MNKKDTIIGTRINLLTPIERFPNYNRSGRTYYKCMCDCGETCFHSLSNLRAGKAYSCGCKNRRGEAQRIDYTGHRFDKLVVKRMLYNYKKKQTYAECKCDCGNTTIAYMGNIKSGKTCSCGCIEASSRFNREHAFDISGNKYGKLTVVRMTDKRSSNGSAVWECHCDCGNTTYASIGELSRGHKKSCGCLKKDFINSTKLTVSKGDRYGFLTIEKEVFDKSYKRRMIECKCVCGRNVIVSLSDLTTGHTSSCGCVFRSKGEAYIDELLLGWGLSYTPQKRFKDCKNKRTLPFDFYVDDRNVCIEYQGSPHYYPVEAWGGEEKLFSRQKNDKLKADYCRNKGIRLICLPYTMSKKEIKKILFDILDPVTITA